MNASDHSSVNTEDTNETGGREEEVAVEEHDDNNNDDEIAKPSSKLNLKNENLDVSRWSCFFSSLLFFFVTFAVLEL